MADNDFFERRCLYKMQRKALRLQFLTEKNFHGFLYKVCVVGLLQPSTAFYSLLQPSTAFYSLLQPSTAFYSLLPAYYSLL